MHPTDEVWLIIRSLKNSGKMKSVPELLPSWKLFKKYLVLIDIGKWNMDSFQNIYVPTFLKEMNHSLARRKFEELIEKMATAIPLALDGGLR